MKIIFLEAVQDFGGAQMSTLELAKRMKDIGHDVLIVDFWGLDDLFIEKINKFGLNYDVIDPRDNPIIISNASKIKTLTNFVKYIPVQIKYRSKLKVIIDSFNADIVSVNNPKCLSLLEEKSTYNIDFFVRTWFSYTDLSSRTKFLLKRYKPRYLTVSQSSRQAVHTGGLASLDNIKVLHSVIDKSLFDGFVPNYQNFNDNNPIKLLHSGGFLPSKGQHLAVEIAKDLKDNGINFELILVGTIYTGGGSNKYYESVIELIDSYQLRDQIKVLVNQTNILSLFEKADVLIHPSTTEGLPRVALEAFTFGVPVIANPVGGVTDIVINNYTGYVTDFNDIKQYVDCITSYYYDSNTYIRHSKQCRNLIEQNYLDSNQNELIKKIYPLCS